MNTPYKAQEQTADHGKAEQAMSPGSGDDSGRFFREIQIEFLVHELKGPISIVETGMRTLLEKREKYGDLSSRQEKTLKRALRNTQKAREMLYDLLEIGRSEAGCFHCAGFQPAKAAYEVLMDALETMAAGIFEQCRLCREEKETIQFLSGCGIFLDISPCLAHTEIVQDEIKFRQILGNLIKNALHHRRGRVEIIMRQEDNRLLTEVSDDGPGIKPEHHQMLFQRYVQIKKENECRTLKRRGHGLGLAGALVLARGLGGDIEVESGNKRKGSTFRLILPI